MHNMILTSEMLDEFKRSQAPDISGRIIHDIINHAEALDRNQLEMPISKEKLCGYLNKDDNTFTIIEAKRVPSNSLDILLHNAISQEYVAVTIYDSGLCTIAQWQEGETDDGK